MVGKLRTRARQLRFERQAKIGKKLSVQEVADAVGVSRQALNNIELNLTEEIKFDVLQRICAYYGVGVEQFFVEEVEEPAQKNRAPRLEQVPLPVA